MVLAVLGGVIQDSQEEMPFTLFAADGTLVLLIAGQCVSEDPDPGLGELCNWQHLQEPAVCSLLCQCRFLHGSVHRGQGTVRDDAVSLVGVPDPVFLTSSQRWMLLLTAVILRSTALEDFSRGAGR